MRVAPGPVSKEIKALAADPDNPVSDEMKDAQLGVRNKLLACMFVIRAHNELYQDLKNESTNDYAKRIYS